MASPKWFERKFDLSFGPDRYASIYEQLKGAPERVRLAVANLPEHVMMDKPGGKWSIKEHMGHLSIMEPLWRIRFQDIRDGEPVLTTADLSNTATTEAGFNALSVDELLMRFVEERKKSLQLLESMDVYNEERTSLHPRLQLPMRVIDLAYFVAEHDDHHVAAICGIRGN